MATRGVFQLQKPASITANNMADHPALCVIIWVVENWSIGATEHPQVRKLSSSRGMATIPAIRQFKTQAATHQICVKNSTKNILWMLWTSFTIDRDGKSRKMVKPVVTATPSIRRVDADARSTHKPFSIRIVGQPE
jgi:hypothetical protein